MSEQNTAIVQQAYENFKTGNIQALLDQLSDNVTWELPEVEGVPLCGKRAGRNSVKEFFATLARDQEVLEFAPREFVAQGDKVVSLGHYQWRVKDTGRNFASDFAHVFTIRDGKVTGFKEYFDSAALASAYRKAMSA
jgi:ketosteroid isomerase-like protein